MAAPMTSRMENEPKEKSNTTMADSSGRGRGLEQTARISSKQGQMISGALQQTVPIELADKSMIGVDSKRTEAQGDGVTLHPKPAVVTTAIEVSKDQSGDRAVAPFAEEAPASQGRETELPEENTAATDQQGGAAISPETSQDNPENNKNTGTDNQTKITNTSILPDGITKQSEQTEEDKRAEGRGDAMEVDTHQTMAEETPTMGNASTTTKGPQPAAAAPPNTKKMILYYEWRKRHHL